MSIRLFSSIEQNVVAGWKRLLSFRKPDWELKDYPVVIRGMRTDLDFGCKEPRFKQERYLARVVNWWVLTGGGDTRADAMRDLATRFDTLKAEWQREGRPMPRPGTRVPIRFAAQERVKAHPELRDDFVRRVLGLEWAWISDESSLSDFHTDETSEALNAKIAEVYGVNVSDIQSGNLAEILDRIAAARR